MLVYIHVDLHIDPCLCRYTHKCIGVLTGISLCVRSLDHLPEKVGYHPTNEPQSSFLDYGKSSTRIMCAGHRVPGTVQILLNGRFTLTTPCRLESPPHLRCLGELTLHASFADGPLEGCLLPTRRLEVWPVLDKLLLVSPLPTEFGSSRAGTTVVLLRHPC